MFGDYEDDAFENLFKKVNDTSKDYSLFLGQVVTINQKKHTINIMPLFGRRGSMDVRVLTRNTVNSNVNFKSNPSSSGGITLLPSLGDIVVCAYLEGHTNYPICLGSIYSDGNTKTSDEAQLQEDWVWHHPSGSIMRFRNFT